MNAIIVCGGLSTRLKDITKTIPKVLLDIKGKTVLDWQLQKIKTLGINEVVLAAGHLSEVLREQVGEERDGVKIIYAVEPQRLGTGGAIKFAWDRVKDPEAPTWVFNGDVLSMESLPIILKNLRPESEGLIYGAYVPDISEFGTLEFDEDNHLTAFKEKEGIKKAGFQNGGIYLFTSHAKKYFDGLGESFSVEYDVFPKMKNLDVFPSRKEWIEIGVPERLAWARENWKI